MPGVDIFLHFAFLSSVADDPLPQTPRSLASPALFQLNSAGLQDGSDGDVMGSSSSDSHHSSPPYSSLESEHSLSELSELSCQYQPSPESSSLSLV